MFTPVAFADYAGTLEVVDRSEVRLQTTQVTATPAVQTLAPQSAPATVGFGLSTYLELGAHIRDRRWEYVLTTGPLLVIQGINPGQTAPILQEASRAAVGWHDRVTRIELSEDATFGTYNSAALVLAATPGQPTTTEGPLGPTATGLPAQPAAAPQTISTLRSLTTGELTVHTDRRTSVAAELSLLRSGGLDATSRLVIPEQDAARADVIAAHDVLRRAQLVTTVSAEWLLFSTEPCISPDGQVESVTCTPDAQLFSAKQGLRAGLGARTILTAAVGATLARSRKEPDEDYHPAIFPTVEVSFHDEEGDWTRTALDADAVLAPVVDFRTGQVRNELQGTASASMGLGAPVSVTLSVSGAQTVATQSTAPIVTTNDVFALTLIGGGAGVDFHVTRHLTLSLGERLQWQSQAAFGTFFSAVSYFAVTAGAPALRL